MKSYYEIVKSADKSGTFTKETMWDSVCSVSKLLDTLKDSDPDKYYEFMRQEFGRMNAYQYDEEFARYDVGQMTWHDKDGNKHSGEYWSISDIEDATKDMQFPSSVTRWTKYVAFNIFATDLAASSSPAQILKDAYEFFFHDEDFSSSKDEYSPCKTFKYMEFVKRQKA
jgi:hypothetical protein